MPRLYLHAGIHKTGTTAIQSFAARNRGALRARGLHYPGYRPFVDALPKAQHKFAHALAEAPGALLTREQAAALPRHWMEEAVGADVFVSVEALYRHLLGDGARLAQREAYLRRVAAALADFEVVVVLVFRRPDTYIRSLYQERVMRMASRLPDFRAIREREATERTELLYHANARLFAGLFSEVRCLIYEDLVASKDFVPAFFRALGVDVAGFEEVGIVRKSLSVPETRVKNFANEFVADREEGEAFLEWMRRPEIAALIADSFGAQPCDLWESHAERAAFLAAREPELEKLRAGFFPGREALFPPLRAQETRPCAPEVPEALRRRILAHLGRDAA